MNAIAKAKPAETVPTTDGGTIAMLIERVATNPNASIETLERLLDMQERVQATRAVAAFNTDLAAMQPKLPIIAERGGIKTSGGAIQSKYALWEDINEAIRPHLADHGFALTFRVDRRDGLVRVTGILSHRDGHSTDTTIELPVDSSGSKNAVQAIGSSTSYGQRYTAKLLLNLTSGGEDDDGRGAGMGAAAQKAIADINSREGLEELRAWKGQHYDGLSKLLEPTELKEVIALYNLRVKRAKGEG